VLRESALQPSPVMELSKARRQLLRNFISNLRSQSGGLAKAGEGGSLPVGVLSASARVEQPPK